MPSPRDAKRNNLDPGARIQGNRKKGCSLNFGEDGCFGNFTDLPRFWSVLVEELYSKNLIRLQICVAAKQESKPSRKSGMKRQARHRESLKSSDPLNRTFSSPQESFEAKVMSDVI